MQENATQTKKSGLKGKRDRGHAPSVPPATGPRRVGGKLAEARFTYRASTCGGVPPITGLRVFQRKRPRAESRSQGSTPVLQPAQRGARGKIVLVADSSARANSRHEKGPALDRRGQVLPLPTLCAALDGFDLLVSNFGVMFFGDPVAAFAHMRRRRQPRRAHGVRVLAAHYRKPVVESADGRGLSPHAAAAETGPASPRNVRLRRSAARLPSPHRCRLGATAADKLDLDLDIAAGRGLEEAVVQSTQIGAVNSWLRGQPAEVVATAIGSIREALAAHVDGATVRLPGAMRLVSSAPA